MWEPYADHLNARGHTLSLTSRKSIERGTKKTWKWVNQGDLLGTVGNSGLEFNTLIDGQYTSLKKEQLENAPSRDEPHIHMRVHFRGNNGAFLSNTQIDPFGIYSTSQEYPSITYSDGNIIGPQIVMKNSIFHQGARGEAAFAR